MGSCLTCEVFPTHPTHEHTHVHSSHIHNISFQKKNLTKLHLIATVLLEMDDEVLLEKVDEVARGPILEYCTFYRRPGYSEMVCFRFIFFI